MHTFVVVKRQRQRQPLLGLARPTIGKIKTR